MAEKSGFHNVGLAKVEDGVFNLLMFAHPGTKYRCDLGDGSFLVNDDGDRVGYVRSSSGKVAYYVTWCLGNLSLPCFPDRDEENVYNVTYPYTYDDDSGGSRRRESDNGSRKSRRW